MCDNSLLADANAKILFDFENVSEPPTKSSAVVAFGNHDEHVAQKAADLYLEGYSDLILFTGGFGRITRKIWGEPEAVRFSRVAIGRGVEQSHIKVEASSANTGENILFSKRKLSELGVDCKKLIMVDRPYRCLRTKLALEKQWPEAQFVMCAPSLSYEGYASWYDSDGPISKSDFISLLVGDIQRIIEYGKLGYQAETEVPGDVLAAYEVLVGMGYTSQMLKANMG